MKVEEKSEGREKSGRKEGQERGGEGWRESQLISNLHCAAVDGICLILIRP